MDEVPPRPVAARPIASRVRDWIDWFGVGRLLLTAASVLAVGAGGYWLLRPPPLPVEADLLDAVDPALALVRRVRQASASR